MPVGEAMLSAITMVVGMRRQANFGKFKHF
jgi:hypothetical protein